MRPATPLHHRRDLPASLERIHRYGLPGHVTSTVCHARQQAVPLIGKRALAHRLAEACSPYLNRAT